MKKEAVVDGSVMRPICSATAGTISAMCTLAPKKPHLYTCPAQELTYSATTMRNKKAPCWSLRLHDTMFCKTLLPSMNAQVMSHSCRATILASLH